MDSLDQLRHDLGVRNRHNLDEDGNPNPLTPNAEFLSRKPAVEISQKWYYFIAGLLWVHFLVFWGMVGGLVFGAVEVGDADYHGVDYRIQSGIQADSDQVHVGSGVAKTSESTSARSRRGHDRSSDISVPPARIPSTPYARLGTENSLNPFTEQYSQKLYGIVFFPIAITTVSELLLGCVLSVKFYWSAGVGVKRPRLHWDELSVVTGALQRIAFLLDTTTLFYILPIAPALFVILWTTFIFHAILTTFVFQLRILISLLVKPERDLFSFDKLQLFFPWKYESSKTSGLVLADGYYKKQELARERNEGIRRVQNELRVELREIEDYRLPEAEKELSDARAMVERVRDEIDNAGDDGEKLNVAKAATQKDGKKSNAASKDPSFLPSHSAIDLSESLTSEGGITDSISISPPTSASPPSRIDTSQYFLEDDNELQELPASTAAQPTATNNGSSSSSPNRDDSNSYFVNYSSPERTRSSSNLSPDPGRNGRNSASTNSKSSTGIVRQLWNGIAGQKDADEPSSQHRVALLEGAESDNSAGLAEIGPGLQSMDVGSTTAAGSVSGFSDTTSTTDSGYAQGIPGIAGHITSSGSFREFEEDYDTNISDLTSHDPSAENGNAESSDSTSFPSFLRGLFGSRGRRAFVHGVRRSVAGPDSESSSREVTVVGDQDSQEMDDVTVTSRMRSGYSRFGDSSDENGAGGGRNAESTREPGARRSSRDRSSSRRKKSGRRYSSITGDGESDSGVSANGMGNSSSSRGVRGREIRGRKSDTQLRPWFLKCCPAWLCPRWLTKLISAFLPAPLRIATSSSVANQCQNLHSNLSKRLTPKPILPLLLAQKLADASLILDFTFPLSLFLRYTIPFEYQFQVETAFSLKSLSRCFCYEFFQIFIKILFFITYANLSSNECIEFLFTNLLFDSIVCFLGCSLAVGDRYADHPDIEMLDHVGEED